MNLKKTSVWISSAIAVGVATWSAMAQVPPDTNVQLVRPKLPAPTQRIDRVVTILEDRVTTSQNAPLSGSRPSIQVQIGQTLTISNSSSELQNAYSDSGGDNDAGFDASIEPSESWSTSFNREGTYRIRNKLSLVDKEFDVIVVGACGSNMIWSGDTCVPCGSLGEPQCANQSPCAEGTLQFEHTCCTRSEAKFTPGPIEVKGRMDQVNCSNDVLKERAQAVCDKAAKAAGATYVTTTNEKFSNQKSWRRMGIGRKMCSLRLDFTCAALTLTCVK